VLGLRLVPDELPLTSLLSQVLIALTVELDNEFEHRTPHFISDSKGPWVGVWLTSYAMYANFLRFVDNDGVRMQELAEKAGYPPPVHPAYHGMRRWGYVNYTPDIAGSSPKKKDADAMVSCTPNGRVARANWAECLRDLQSRWRERGLDALQAALIPIASEIERPLPEYLPNVTFDRRQPELVDPLSRPAIDLDLLGLLSQCLLGMTYDYEAASPLALGTLSGLLEPLTEEPVPTRNLYELTGVATKEWSSAMTQVAKAGIAELGGKPTSIRLTPAGLDLKAQGTRTLAAVEAQWRKAHGGPQLDKLRRELERVVDDAWTWTDPYPDGWRAKARLPRRLAHHPIVSHRGGYPDGS
jgi:hypothetical protein